MKAMVCLGVFALLAGCDSNYIDPPEPVVIVAVTEDNETGPEDWYTVVEFPDGDRRRRYGRYGEVGDLFTACKYYHPNAWNGWRPHPQD